jgi:hypothetical protein
MSNIVERAKNILLSPKTEWPVIAAEPATIQSVYIPYVLVLAAIRPICLMIGGGGLGWFTFSSGFLVKTAIWTYCSSLLSVFILAAIVNALAPTFGSEKNMTQAVKTAAYAYTASWIAGIGGLLGLLGGLIGLAGAIYSLYLLYLALPHTMKTPQEKATSYTVIVVVVAIVVYFVLAAVGAAVFIGSGGARGLFGGGFAAAPSRNEQVLDPNSPLGRLEKMGHDMEKAEKEGKTKDPGQALGAVMGALAGSGGAVESLPADRLKAFVPESLAGEARKSISAEKNGAFGIQVSSAKANYGERDRSLNLEITDTGGAAGRMAFAGWANIEGSKEEGTRTERTGKEGGHIVHEEWDSASKSGEYTVVLGSRFVVKVQGNADSLGDLKGAAASVDLAGLEALRGEGMKASN